MLRIFLLILAVLGAIVLAVTLVGYTLPVAHTATREVSVAVPPETVFALISRVEDYPSWRSDVDSVHILAEGGTTRFREFGSNGAILFEIEEAVPTSRLVTRIADPTLPFGGRWTFHIATTTRGSTLRITENGEVYNPIFRFVSRFIIGHDATIESYLSDVSRRFAQSQSSLTTAAPQP